MSRIDVIRYAEATGRLKEIYEELIASRGKIAEVHMIQSLRPESIVKHMALYMEIMYSRSEVSRAERELVGTIVSRANGCKYCAQHHAEALNHFWRDHSKIEKLLCGDGHTVFTPREIALCEFVNLLTRHPEQHEAVDHTIALKSAGFSDAAILDIVLVTAYFNFVNRIVLALGVEIENDGGRGYAYE